MRLNGTLMSGNYEVAKVVDGEIIPIKKELMPLYLQRMNNIEGWLADRAIDKHRTNSRLLKKALRLTAAEDLEVVLRVHGATITDNYWYREEGSNLTYDEVKFKANMFDKLALYGDPDSFNNDQGSTPELTNIGSYEKCWRLENDEWWLYKQGNDNERFSELFIYHLGKALGFTMAHYELGGEYIKTPDFTKHNQVNYEAMYSIVNDDEDYVKSFDALVEICPEASKDFVKMIYLDSICFNMDRHTKNYGVLRDTETGKINGLAPNFDNNIALISRGYPSNISRDKDRMISLFCEFVLEREIAKSIYEEINKESITDELIKECIDKTGFNVDAEKVSTFIINGVKTIQKNTRQ